jgi:heme A synthase
MRLSSIFVRNYNGNVSRSTAAMPKTASIPELRPPAGPSSSPPRFTQPGSFARFAWAVLAYNVFVVLWGAGVRASGSGAGCGDRWPLCNGLVTSHFPAIATLIEFAHRASTGVDTALVAVLVIWAFRKFPRGHAVRLGATLSGVFLVTEALVGAALVLLHHVGDDTSPGRVFWLSAHLINTLSLLGCLTLTAWWGMGNPRFRIAGRQAWMAAASVIAVAALGASGAIAAVGDTVFPVNSLAAGLAQDFDPAANIFIRLRIFHPVIAVLVSLWLVIFGLRCATRTTAGSPNTRKLALSLIALVGVQLLAGAMNLLMLTPIAMQLVHLFLADLLWINLVVLSAATLAITPKAPSPEGAVSTYNGQPYSS